MWGPPGEFWVVPGVGFGVDGVELVGEPGGEGFVLVGEGAVEDAALGVEQRAELEVVVLAAVLVPEGEKVFDSGAGGL